jgi:hypothetical protein
LIRRTTKIALEILGALLAGIALLVAFLAWRLIYEGPIHMAFLAPYVERSIAEANRDFRVEIEDTVLTWAGWPRGLDLRAINLHVKDQRERDLAVLPEVSFTLSARAMLRGLVAPSKVEVLSPDLALRRRADGVLMFGLQKLEQEANETATAPSPGEVIEELLDDSDPDKPAGYLKSISIVDGKIAIDDRGAGMVWEAHHVNFEIARNADATLGGRLSAELPQFGQPALATATVTIDPKSHVVSADAAFQGLDLASLGLIEPKLAELSNSEVTLSGRMSAQGPIGGVPGAIDFQLNTANGTLNLPGRLKEPVPLKLMQATGRIDVNHDLLHLEKLSLDIGGPTIEASADVDGAMTGAAADGGQPLLKLLLKAEHYPASWMDRYWPTGAAENTRTWLVPNIPEGMVEEVKADLALRLPGPTGDAAKLEHLKGEMKTSGLTVHYLRPMPPITDGTATATFDADSFDADITGGHVGDIRIQKGYLHITGLDVEDQFIKVGGDVAASLSDTLKLLDHPRLGYAKKLGLKPEEAGGEAQASIDFDFPAEKSLGFDRVKIKVGAQVKHVAMKRIRFGQDVTDGTLDLKLDQNGMTVSGPVKYAGSDLDIQWQQQFGDKVDVRETFQANGRTSTGSRALVGYDFRPWVDGPSDVALKFTRRDDGHGLLEASFDLKDAILAMDFLKWRKPAGTPAKGSLKLNLKGDQPIDIKDLTIDGDGFSIAGGATFAPDGKSIGKLALKKANIAKSAITDLVADFSNDATNVSVGGGVMDVEPWMVERDKPVTPAELDAQELKPQRPYSIAGQLAKVRLSEGDELTNITFDIRHDPIWWDKIYFNGALPSGVPIVFSYAPMPEDGTHRLKVETEDGGGAFKTLGIYDSIKGGKLLITGVTKDSEPHRPIQGQMKMTSFRLLHTPFAVRFLSVATLTGLVDSLTGEGFLFAGASAKFAKTRGKVDVSDFRSAGPSIGLTSKGTIDMDANTIDLKGALVPAYALNSILGNIPIIGEWLQGGKGEGLFSATYEISGDLNEPKINVNGWSALAPGFIRNLFEGENTAPLEERKSNRATK